MSAALAAGWIVLFTAPALGAQLSTETPTATPTVTSTAAPTLFPTLTATPTATPTQSPAPPTPEFTPAAEQTLDVEAAAEHTPESTAEITVPTITATAAASSTETAFESTAEVTPEATALMPSPLPPTLTATAPVVIETILIAGRASYQSSEGDNSGITLSVYTIDRLLVSSAQTDVNGGYTLAVPANEFYWLTADAPRHRQFTRGVYPQDTLLPIVLAGGDLDGDGCIAAWDIALLQADLAAQTAAGDINADGVTDVRDLAILTGNYDPVCQPIHAVNTPAPVVEVTPEVTGESTTEPVITLPEPTAEATAQD